MLKCRNVEHVAHMRGGVVSPQELSLLERGSLTFAERVERVCTGIQIAAQISLSMFFLSNRSMAHLRSTLGVTCHADKNEMPSRSSRDEMRLLCAS